MTRKTESLTEINCIPKVNERFISENGLCYKLISVISEGGFGTVFKASCTTNNVNILTAIKAEKWNKSLQFIEIAVLKSARNNGCRHFPQLIDHGSVDGRFHFIAMTLLGSDLHKLRKEQPGAKFSLSTAVRIGYQTMKSIEELHVKCRYICRDIKPSNFVIGLHSNNAQRRIYMVDFGLCRRFMNDKNQILQSRGEVGWRGTSRYGSLHCHLCMDLGRRDDLESWFYMLVELTTGYLPWHQEKDRDLVHSAKVGARTVGRRQFFDGCPAEYEHIMNKIDAMVFAEEPNYQLFYSIMKKICVSRRIRKSDPYDWELVFKEPTMQHNIQNLALTFLRTTDQNNNNCPLKRNEKIHVVPQTTVTTVDEDEMD